jgi:hypothetical protein
MRVKSSFIVRLQGQRPGDIMRIEADARPGGLNGGRTQFYAGGTIYLLGFHTPNITVFPPVTTLGTSLPGAGYALAEISDTVVFDHTTATAELSYPINAGLQSVAWQGVTPGSLVVSGNTVYCNLLPAYREMSDAGTPWVAAANVTYKSRALVYRLDTPVTLAGLAEYELKGVWAGISQ